MARLSSLLFLIAATSVVLILSVAPQAAASDHRPPHHKLGSSLPLLITGKLSTVCKGTDYPALCMSTLGSTKSASVSTQTAIIATIRAIEAKTKTARAFSQKLAGSAKDSMTRQNLKVCAEVYDDAIYELEKSLTSARSRNRAGLINNLSAAMTYFETCNDGFAESNPGKRSPLASYNDAMQKMASNGLALASMLH